VTVVATGLGAMARVQRKPEMSVVQGLRTGTDNASLAADIGAAFDLPSVVHGRGARNAAADAMAASGVDKYDIPAFLRKQAD